MELSVLKNAAAFPSIVEMITVIKFPGQWSIILMAEHKIFFFLVFLPSSSSYQEEQKRLHFMSRDIVSVVSSQMENENRVN